MPWAEAGAKSARIATKTHNAPTFALKGELLITTGAIHLLNVDNESTEDTGPFEYRRGAVGGDGEEWALPQREPYVRK